MSSSEESHPFDQLAAGEEAALRVAEAALWFAADHCPDLRMTPWLERLNTLARRVEALAGRSLESKVTALRTVLVEQEGLTGNAENYHDPRNSFLHEVLERRLGIPISLSVIWLDVCEQLAWPFFGVDLPGHFIIAGRQQGPLTLIDPFHEGRGLSFADCRERVAKMIDASAELTEDDFHAVDKKRILVRMLNNLRGIYSRDRAWRRCACVLARLRALQPQSKELQQESVWVSARLAELN